MVVKLRQLTSQVASVCELEKCSEGTKEPQIRYKMKMVTQLMEDELESRLECYDIITDKINENPRYVTNCINSHFFIIVVYIYSIAFLQGFRPRVLLFLSSVLYPWLFFSSVIPFSVRSSITPSLHRFLFFFYSGIFHSIFFTIWFSAILSI